MRASRLGFRTSVWALAVMAMATTLVLAAHLFALLARAETNMARLVSDVSTTRLAGDLDMMHDALRADVLEALHTGWQVPEPQRKAIEGRMVRNAQRMRESLEQLLPLVRSEAARQALTLAQPDLVDYVLLSADAVRAAQGVGFVEEGVLAAHRQAYSRLEEALAQVSETIESHSRSEVDAQVLFFSSARLYTLVGLALVVSLLALACAAFVKLNLRRLGADPAELGQVARRIADGDLGATFERVPPAHSVGDEMLRMQNKLTEAVVTIRTEAASLASASNQIASNHAELAGRYEEQMAALGASATNMDLLGTTVATNAESALRAADMATAASDVARAGGEAVAQVVQTMSGITQAAQRIGDITGLIDSIAFQTNILALNAAVEAARAGEAGRGFAVVAGEVRSLARRSAEAAREIRQLTAGTVEAVQRGAEQVDQAGDTVRSVVEAILGVTRTVNEISESSFQQTDGVQRLSMDVGRLQQSTESNAVMVQEGAVATAELSTQAGRLLALAGRFQVPGAALEAAGEMPADGYRPLAHVDSAADPGPATAPASRRASARAPVARAAQAAEPPRVEIEFF